MGLWNCNTPRDTPMFMIGFGLMLIFFMGLAFLFLMIGLAIPKYGIIKQVFYGISGILFSVPFLLILFFKLADLNLQDEFAGRYTCVCEQGPDLTLVLEENKSFKLIQKDSNKEIRKGTWNAWEGDLDHIIDFECDADCIGQARTKGRNMSLLKLSHNKIDYECQLSQGGSDQ
ncbi:MAG: hypothetical protein NXI20_01690 [bacterium]|nr:hypothetical protein [bacterium]